MSRSGYSEDYDYDYWGLIRWRGAVKSALRGRRGQAFLREMLTALNVMPVHRLIREELEKSGEVCALGAVGMRRGLNISQIDPGDRAAVAGAFGIAEAMAAEIMYENDEYRREMPEQRWERMRKWIASQIRND